MGDWAKRKKNKRFEEIGFTKRRIFPSAVHQYLSPNDNRFHGIVKSKWRDAFGDREIKTLDTISVAEM